MTSQRSLFGITACLLIFSATLSGPLAAPGGEGQSGSAGEVTVFLGARLGYIQVDNVESGELTLGFVGGANVHEHISLSLALDYEDGDIDPNTHTDFVNHSTYALSASMAVYLLSERFRVRPYGVGGVGYYRSDVERFDQFGDSLMHRSSSDGGYHAGVGIDIGCCLSEGEAFAVALEARWIFTDWGNALEAVTRDGVQYTLGEKFIF